MVRLRTFAYSVKYASEAELLSQVGKVVKQRGEGKLSSKAEEEKDMAQEQAEMV